MPQLDIYTFTTQIYTIALLFFAFLILFSYWFVNVLFFESEIFERYENTLTSAPVTTRYELNTVYLRHLFIVNRLSDVFNLFLKKT